MKDANITFGPGDFAGDPLADGSAKTAFGEIAVAPFEIQAGWSFNYNINPEAITEVSQNGGSVTQEDSFANIQSGTDPGGFAFIRTKRAVAYTPGIGAIARFTAVFDTPQENSNQLIGIGNDSDGWFFGYNGLQFGIMKRRGGVDEWIYQDQWNANLRPDFNPQKGNVYEIKYQWLGFGMQYFGVEDDAGNISHVHKLKYANLNEQVSVFNPTLPIAAGVANFGNTTNISLKTPSAIGGTQGEANPSAMTVPVGYKFEDTIITGLNYLFSLQNPALYLGKDNRQPIEPIFLTLTTEGNKPVVFRVILNPVLTAPAWVDINTGVTPLQGDIAATAYTGGDEVLTIALGKIDSSGVIDLTPLRSIINAESILTLVADSQGASEITVGATFRSRI